VLCMKVPLDRFVAVRKVWKVSERARTSGSGRWVRINWMSSVGRA